MTRRCRVLHVLKYYRPAFTGEGVFMERCTGAMQILAPEVEHDLLVTTTPRPATVPPGCSTLNNVFYLSRRPLNGVWQEVVLLWWCLRHLHRYHTVHVRTHFDWYMAAYYYAKLVGCRLVLSATLDDSVPVIVGRYRAPFRSMALRAFRRFDVFVSISTRLHQETSAVMPAERCQMVPLGVTFGPHDPAIRESMRVRLGIPAHANVLIFAGGLCARKDPLFLARHLPAILQRHPDTWLLLVGPELEPDYVAALRCLIRDNALAARVIFTGEVSNPHPYFAASDIMVFASHLEGFGTVVPEAQANGLPVVVRRLPGVNDLFVQDGETGFLFDDDVGYLSAVLRLLDDPALRQRVGRAAQGFVRATFDLHQVARRYLSIYGFPDVSLLSPDQQATLAPIGNSASIINRRLHRPAVQERIDCPVLLTMIDAEEEFDWNAPFSRESICVESMRHQTPAQCILDRFGAVPTYMVDYPIVSQDAGVGPLREMLRDGRCDVGTQLHPWVTPPFQEALNNHNSYSGNLPVPLEFEKLRRLTERIEHALGVRPRIYRAGRYGVGPRTADLLMQLGYLADTSVMPGWDFTSQEGPDFSLISTRPYWFDDAQRLLEIPISCSVVGKMSRLPGPVVRTILSRRCKALALPSLTARLRLMERIKLTPEGITVSEAKRLIRHLLEGGQRVFVVSYHTPSLIPGNTPYVRDKADLTRFLSWLEEVYGFFMSEIGGRCSTWREVRALLLEETSAGTGMPATPSGQTALASLAGVAE